MKAALISLVVMLASSVAVGQTQPWPQEVDWSKAPAAAKGTAWKPPMPVKRTLKNGMTLLVIENHRLPLVSMVLVVKDAGTAQDPAGKGGLADFTADLMDEGAGDLDALAFSAKVESLGASISLGTEQDEAFVDVSSLTRTLPDTLRLLGDVVMRPRFGDADFARVREDRKAGLDLRVDQPRVVAALWLWQLLFGAGTPYGHPGGGTKGEFDGIDLTAIKAFHAARWTPRAMTLVVAGDVSPDAMVTALDAVFAEWKPRAVAPAKVSASRAKSAGRLFIVDRPGSEQVDVRLGTLGIKPRDPRAPAIDVLTNLLGGTFTSRLNHRLREELGWTYGARMVMPLMAVLAPLYVTTALVTPHTVEGVAEILKILAAVVSGDLPDEELAKAKENLIQELPTHFAGNADLAGAYAELVEAGLPLDHYQTYAARIAKVSKQQVKAAAKQLLVPEQLIVVAVGDAKTIREGLEKVFGPATMLSPDLK